MGNAVSIPYWPIALTSAILATLPWLRWQFSLRTLLIAMTILAAVLGLIVWAAN
jgi:hypothetical protein